MPSQLDPEKSRDIALVDAYRVANRTTDVGKVENGIDSIVNGTTAAAQSPAFTFVNEFYAANKDTITAAAAGLASLEPKAIEAAISKFSETAKVVMSGLDALAQVHPFIGVAVVAFKLVITLDLTRRENNQKVMALRVQMQDTMCVLFQLRHMKDPEEEGPDGITVKDRMQGLIMAIAKSIQECGSACDAYLKKSFLSRTLKSKVYESRLAGWASTFADHQTQLEQALAVHIALGVEKANQKLDKQQATLKSIETTMLDIFKKLETPREREMTKFLEENGGVRACIERDDLLTKLISKSGESLSAVAQRSAAKGNDDIVAARKGLLKEMAEDVDNIFKKNLAVFEAKMAIQQEQITDAMEKQGRQIMSVLLSGAHERIVDADLQHLWKEMGWKGSVKARHFVLALRDYFTDQLTVAPVPATPGVVVAASLPTPTTPDTFPSPNEPDQNKNCDDPIHIDDRWTLEYITVAQLQPIIEAIDDDGTGFISIKEANTFAMERPKGWTLLHWLAFWAKGWHHSISRYQNQIYLLIQEMHRNLECVKADNRFLVDWYLDSDFFRTIEQLLRSTGPVDENDQMDSNLSQLTELYIHSEEERLERNLKSIGYNIDSAATVALITGQGRIERYVFPLIFLLLQHHLRIIKIACQYIIHTEELDYWAVSFESIAAVIKHRAEYLGAIYKQAHADASLRLENFAFGMYRLIWGSPETWKPSDNSISSWQDRSIERNESQTENREEDLQLLHYPHQTTFSYQTIDVDLPVFELDSEEPIYPSGPEGVWTGHCYHTDSDNDRISVKGLVMIRILNIDMHRNVTGRAVSCCGMAEVSGRAEANEDGTQNVTITLHDEEFEDTFYHLSGIFDPLTQTIEGTYEVEGEDDEEDEPAENERDEEDDNEADDDEADEDEDDEGVAAENSGEGSDGEAENEESGDQITEISEVGDSEDIPPDDEVEEREIDEEVNASDVANADDGDGGEQVVEDEAANVESFTFILRRTTPELYRFRYNDGEYAQNAAKARWSFACRVASYLVQKKRWAWPYLRDRMREARRAIELRQRSWDAEADMTPDHALGSEEQNELDTLDESLSPSVSGLCRALANYASDREAYLFNISCDNCERSILYPGYQCLQCVSADLSTRVRLCPDCVDQQMSVDTFVHDQTHSMLKSFVVIHDYRLAFVINNARTLVERIKATLRGIETSRKSQSDLKSKSKSNKFCCACCNARVSAPCYVCVDCTRDTFVCNGCEVREAQALKDGPAPYHGRFHITIRLFDTTEEKFEQDATDVTIKRLEGLESTLQDRVNVLEERLSKLEGKLDERFNSFEALLTQLMRMKEGGM